jgi:HK97 gp10 family phage protein
VNEVTFLPNPLVGVEWERTAHTQAMIANLGEEVAQKARELAPVDTGALRDSITSELVGGGGPAEAQIVANVPYAGFVEFGTDDTPMQPYLRPALDAAVGRSSL